MPTMTRMSAGALLLCVLSFPCQAAGQWEAGGASAGGLPPLDLPAVEREIRAQVTAPTTTVLSSEIGARIVGLTVRDGERFTKDQVLVRFDCGVQENQLARARAVLDKRLRVLEVNERLQRLGSISAKEIAVGAAEVEEARAELGMMKELVSRCTIHAPFAGRVAAVAVHEHQFIGEGEPLLDILDDSVLELETIVPSRWLTWLKPGTGFEVAVDETGRRYPAVVTRLSGRVDPVSQSIKLYARIDGDRADLLPGMSGRALLAPPEGAL